MNQRFFFTRTLSILTTGIVFCAAILLYAPCLYAQGAAFIPTQEKDPYFFPLTSGGKTYPGQWHLWNKMPTPAGGVNAGLDAGLEKAWNVRSSLGYTGRGVVIGIVDDGVEGNHEDIKDNYRADLSKNFSQDAYDAYLWKSGLNNTTLAIESAPAIHIKNHSYGPDEPFDTGPGNERIKNVLQATSENAVIHVVSAGNSRNQDQETKLVSCEDANKDFTLTSPYVLPVAALGSDGTYAVYSSYGANVFVTAPSSSYANYYGITTTDRTGADFGYNKYDAVKNPVGDKWDDFPDTNYASAFGGTSSAAPLVSGIMALGKEANPLMSIRMAKHALSLPTVTDKVDAPNDGWILNNGVDIRRNFNPNFGFGLIRADKFVGKIEEVRIPF